LGEQYVLWPQGNGTQRRNIRGMSVITITFNIPKESVTIPPPPPIIYDIILIHESLTLTAPRFIRLLVKTA
jgi:hypothetical protein